MANIKDISIVVPLLNEAPNLLHLYNEIKNVISSLQKSYELIFVDDGSTDNSFEEIKLLAQKDENVNGVSLSRNFGHQIALFAGLKYANGNTVVTMDADMQHPPLVIAQLYEKYLQGYDIVNTRRIDTGKLSLFKRLSSKYFYIFINQLSEVKIEAASSDFRLMNRKAVNAFLSIEERDRFTRGLVSWMGFKQTIVPYESPERFAGKSKYNLRRMIQLGLNGITSFSAKPLRLAFLAGIFLIVWGFLYTTYAIISHFVGNTVEGWTSLLISILIIGGFQLFTIGIIGEYIARIFNETKSRPVFFVNNFAGKLFISETTESDFTI